jgi:signal transduction histidine kinase
MQTVSLPRLSLRSAIPGRIIGWRGIPLVALTAAYVLVFPLLYPTRGATTAALSVVPVLLIGWWFGLRMVLAAGALFFVLNTTLISQNSGMTWSEVIQHSGFGSGALLLVGVVMGRLHDLESSMQRELNERRRAEEALTQHHAMLEQVIAERTHELRVANEMLQLEVAERRQIEADLQAALDKEKELNQLKLRFTSMVSHEFRTPLTGIQTSADILKRYSSKLSDESKADKLERIQTHVSHMVTLLNDVMSINRADALGLEYNPRLTDLRDYCRSIAHEFQLTGGSHHIQCVTDETPTLALVDAKLLRQALTNLITNAMKYSARGTTVAIALKAEGDHAIIRVRDQGIGIPEDDQKDLFEIFHRAQNVGKVQGTGLGLTIAKQAVEAHGGTIAVQSVLNRGTEFTICLPLVVVEE